MRSGSSWNRFEIVRYPSSLPIRLALGPFLSPNMTQEWLCPLRTGYSTWRGTKRDNTANTPSSLILQEQQAHQVYPNGNAWQHRLFFFTAVVGAGGGDDMVWTCQKQWPGDMLRSRSPRISGRLRLRDLSANKFRPRWEDMVASTTSSTAQGGGGSFKNRKPKGAVGCCEPLMDQKVLEVSSLSLSFSDYLPTYLPTYLPS